jgi:hypothetical protein
MDPARMALYVQGYSINQHQAGVYYYTSSPNEPYYIVDAISRNHMRAWEMTDQDIWHFYHTHIERLPPPTPSKYKPIISSFVITRIKNFRREFGSRLVEIGAPPCCRPPPTNDQPFFFCDFQFCGPRARSFLDTPPRVFRQLYERTGKVLLIIAPYDSDMVRKYIAHTLKIISVIVCDVLLIIPHWPDLTIPKVNDFTGCEKFSDSGSYACVRTTREYLLCYSLTGIRGFADPKNDQILSSPLDNNLRRKSTLGIHYTE